MEKKQILFQFVGDILHTPESLDFLAKISPPESHPNYDYLFEHILSHFQGETKPDFICGNFEMPILPSLPPGMQTIYKEDEDDDFYYFNGHQNYLLSLQKLGFNVLQTSNNHAFDQGKEGVISTVSFLEKCGIPYTGTSKIPGEFAYVKTTQSGLKVAFLAFAEFLNGGNQQNEYKSPNINMIPLQLESDLDESKLAQKIKFQIQEVKNRHSPDVFVVLPHWGEEYAPLPDEEYRQQGKFLIESGADLVIGTHPHILQPYEIVNCEGRSGLICYSMGNFTSGWAQEEGNNYSAVLRVVVTLGNQNDPKLSFEKLSFIPIFEHPKTFQLYFAEQVLKEEGGKKTELSEMAKNCIDSMNKRLFQLTK